MLCQICSASVSLKNLNKVTYNKVSVSSNLANSNNKDAHKTFKGKFLGEKCVTSQPKLQVHCEIEQTNNLN